MKPFDLFIVLWNKKFKLLFISIFTCIATYFLSDLLPKYYLISMKLSVSNPTSSNMSLIPDIKGLSKSMLGGLAKSGSNQSVTPIFQEFLGGRDNYVHILKKFHLDTLYNKTSTELLLKQIPKDLNFELDDETDLITINYMTKDRNQGIQIVKEFTNHADLLYRQYQKRLLSNSTQFLKYKTQSSLDSLYKSIKQYSQFLKQNKIYDLESQLKASYEINALDERNIQDLEIEAQVLRANSSLDNPRLQEITDKIHSIKASALKRNQNTTANSIFITPNWAVDKNATIQEFEAKIKFQTEIYYMNSMELIRAESDLAKNQPVVEVVQDVFYPDWKSKPKRLQLIAIALVLSLSFSCVIFVLLALKRKELELDSDTKTILLRLNLIKS